jgi:hypothetical protein
VTGALAAATGAATPTAGSTTSVPVVGQSTGRAINLLFTVGDGQYLFGVGTMEHDLATCDGAMGGPFVGPQPGDAGDWELIASSQTGLDANDICGACIAACQDACPKCTTATCSNSCTKKKLCK